MYRAGRHRRTVRAGGTRGSACSRRSGRSTWSGWGRSRRSPTPRPNWRWHCPPTGDLVANGDDPRCVEIAGRVARWRRCSMDSQNPVRAGPGGERSTMERRRDPLRPRSSTATGSPCPGGAARPSQRRPTCLPRRPSAICSGWTLAADRPRPGHRSSTLRNTGCSRSPTCGPGSSSSTTPTTPTRPGRPPRWRCSPLTRPGDGSSSHRGWSNSATPSWPSSTTAFGRQAAPTSATT